MQIVCVSRGTFGGGVELAEQLAAKLGYQCIGREEITDAATRAGIPVGKLEMAVVKRRPMTEQLAADKARYAAFITATLCERLGSAGIVYHGRTGHVVLPGVSHVLRVRAITDLDDRISRAMSRLKIEREKARHYVEQVDEDRHRWVATLYGLDWDDPRHYDMVLNLTHLSVQNAAAGLVGMAQMPEFQPTPASRKLVANLWLAAKCRLAVGYNQYTRGADVQVRAEEGKVSVTYLPRDRDLAERLPHILEEVEGVREIRCTMATTSILWVQERYDPAGSGMDQILDIAERWGAAVELAQLMPTLAEEGENGATEAEADEAASADADSAEADEDGEQPEPTPSEQAGILDDSDEEDEPDGDDGGVEATVHRLIEAGRAGGNWKVTGGPQELIDRMDPAMPYSLAVVGDVYIARGEAVRKRMTRELVGYLGDHLKAPVVGVDDLKTQYLFGPAQWLRLIVFGALSLSAVYLVLTNQVALLQFLQREGLSHRLFAVACVVVFVPIFAYLYGGFTQFVLKLFKFE